MSLLSFQRGYLAEPLSEEEQTKINTYLTICKNTFLYFHKTKKIKTYLKICKNTFLYFHKTKKINTYLTICKNTFAIFNTNSIHNPHGFIHVFNVEMG